MQLTIITLLPFAFVFCVGLVCGYVAHNRLTFTKGNLQIAIAVVITLVWVVAVIAEIVMAPYTVSPLLHGIMGALAGWLFTAGKKKEVAERLSKNKRKK